MVPRDSAWTRWRSTQPLPSQPWHPGGLDGSPGLLIVGRERCPIMNQPSSPSTPDGPQPSSGMNQVMLQLPVASCEGVISSQVGAQVSILPWARVVFLAVVLRVARLREQLAKGLSVVRSALIWNPTTQLGSAAALSAYEARMYPYAFSSADSTGVHL